MAASLYGSDVFTSALRKVTTDGQLFEATMYENIGQLLSEQKALVNMYEAFRSFREEHIDTQEREDLYKKLLDEKSSLFASHPTFAERVEALAGAPQAVESQSTTAMHLFEKPAELEQEMTDFLTAVMRHARLTAATAG